MIHKRMLQRMKAVTGILLLLSLACGCGAGKEAGSPKDASAQGGRQADQEREKRSRRGVMDGIRRIPRGKLWQWDVSWEVRWICRMHSRGR